MKIGVLYVASGNVNSEEIEVQSHELIDRLNAKTGLEMKFVEGNYSFDFLKI